MFSRATSVDIALCIGWRSIVFIDSGAYNVRGGVAHAELVHVRRDGYGGQLTNSKHVVHAH